MKVCVGIRTEKPTAQVLSAHVWHGQMMIAKLVSGDSQAPQCPTMLRNGILHIRGDGKTIASQLCLRRVCTCTLERVKLLGRALARGTWCGHALRV
jgi:hypothetical protein